MGKIVTSYGISKMTGKVGDAVFSIEQGGTGMRNYNPISKQPFTPVQLKREAAFKKANQAWTTIGIPAATAWRVWGRTQKVRTVSGGYRTREGKDCFSGLYAKLLQMNPAAAIPVPPTGTFYGDDAILQVELKNGVATWTSDSANRVGVTTELMAQRLPSEVALPSKEYKTLGFFTFTAGGLSTDTPLAVGYWSLGYQFVEKATGRVTGFTSLGTQTVSLAVVQGGANEAADSAPAPLQREGIKAKKAA